MFVAIYRDVDTDGKRHVRSRRKPKQALILLDSPTPEAAKRDLARRVAEVNRTAWSEGFKLQPIENWMLSRYRKGELVREAYQQMG